MFDIEKHSLGGNQVANSNDVVVTNAPTRSEFALDMWYVAALSAEVSDKPLARTLLNEPVVDSSGQCNSLTKLLICMSAFYETSKANFHPG